MVDWIRSRLALAVARQGESMTWKEPGESAAPIVATSLPIEDERRPNATGGTDLVRRKRLTFSRSTDHDGIAAITIDGIATIDGQRWKCASIDDDRQGGQWLPVVARVEPIERSSGGYRRDFR
jgi:hypothetical protein